MRLTKLRPSNGQRANGRCMDDQRTDQEGSEIVRRQRVLLRLLFWGAVASSLFALVSHAYQANTRGVVIDGVLATVSLLMAISIELRLSKR